MADFLKNFPVHLSLLEEQEILNAQVYLEHCITQKNEEDPTHHLIAWPEIKLIKLCQDSEIIHRFCMENRLFNEKLTELLRAKKYLALPLINSKGIRVVTVFDLYLSASFLHTFLDTSNSKMLRQQALKHACLFGLWDACVLSCHIQLTALKRPGLSNEKKVEMIHAIFARTHQLTELYWCAGYIQAAAIMMQLTLALTDNDAMRDDIANRATKYFICASLIEEASHSKLLINHLTHKQGVDALLEMGDSAHLNSWSSIKECIFSNPDEKFSAIKDEAILEVGDFLRHSTKNPPLKRA